MLLVPAARPALAGEPLREVVGRERTHPVVEGETLYSIGKSYSLAIEHLAFANGLPVGMAAPAGRELIVPTRRVLPVNPPQSGLVVNLPERGVFLFRNGEYEKFYPIAIGQPGRFATPEGSYRLESRVENPTWLPPEWAGLGEITVAAGPENPLGDRWMGLSLPGVGLHSTLDPTSIGAAVSHGCMRMYPESAHELFDKVTVGMPVRIEYDPVKVGYDPEAGEVLLVAFPDVYGRYNLSEHAREVLRRVGLSQWVDDKQLNRLVSRASGRPETILKEVEVTVAGEPVDAPMAGILGAGSMWVSSDVARALGLQLEWDPAARRVRLSKGDQSASFTVMADSPAPGQEAGAAAYQLNGRTLFPARQLLSQFGIPFQWEPGTRTLRIES